MNDRETHFFAGVFVTLGFLVLVPFFGIITSILNGYVLQKLWWWFVVPAFHVSPLAFWPAVGVSFIVRVLTGHYTKDDRKFWQIMVAAVLGPFFTLFAGWTIHLVAS